MTAERTIADLLEDRQDLSLIADALRDASEGRSLDLSRLRELLAPLASRNGFKKDDGSELLERLMRIAGIDMDTCARQIAANPALGVRVTAEFIGQLMGQKLLASARIDRPARAVGDSISGSIAAALQREFGDLWSATLAGPAQQQLARQLGIDVLRLLGHDWTNSLTQGLTLKPETLSLIRNAQRAARHD